MRPANIGTALSHITLDMSPRLTAMPFAFIFFSISPIKISPNPSGSAIYGVCKPNVSAHATARRSIFSEFMILTNGGIKIGIKAICTGIKFCEKHAKKAIEKIKTYFLSLIKFATARTKIAVKLVFEIALAMTPSSRYESAVSKFPPMPRLPAFSGLPFMNKFMASPSGILLESTAHIVPIRIASITLHLSKHSAHITQILINTGLVSIFCLFWNFCNYIEFRAKFC